MKFFPAVYRSGWFFTVCLFLLTLWFSAPVRAQSVSVNTVNDLINAFSAGGQTGATVTFGSNNLRLTLPSTLSGSLNNLSLNGNNGYILGTNTFGLVDMGTYTFGSIANIHMQGGNNTAGFGGAFNAQNLTGGIANSTFSNNAAANGGGAVYIADSFAGGIRSNLHFDSNKATGVNANGGAVYVGGSFSGGINGTGGDVHFDNNTATGSGGGMFVNNTFSGDIYATYFATNTAGGNGGGLFVGNDFNGSLTAYAFFLRNQSAGSGGGLYVGNNFSGTLTGFTFEGNKANGGDGGGAYIGGTMNNRVDMAFASNSASGNGGGLFIGTNNGQIRNNFTSNTAGGSGGAVYIQNAQNQDVTASFTGNTAGIDGGALWAGSFSGILGYASGNTTSLFRNNRSGTAGSGNGGAVYIQGDFTNPSAIQYGISNVVFDGNSAQGTGSGGALYIGGIQYNGIQNTTFSGNTAGGNGGGAYIMDLQGNLTSLSFTGNTATAGNGGGLYTGAGLTNIQSGQFTENTAGLSGGAVYAAGNITGTISGSSFVSNTAGADGGAIYSGGTLGTVSGTNFVGNKAGGSGGALFAAGLTGNFSSVTFGKNIAAGSGGALYTDSIGGAFDTVYFVENSAGGSGGGLYVTNDFTQGITNAAFGYNTAAGGSGGGMYVGGSLGFLEGQFLSNTASADGGGANIGANLNSGIRNLELYSNAAGSGSGGGVNIGGNLAGGINNSTIAFNTAGGNGGGLNIGGNVTGGINALQADSNTAGGSGGAINIGGSLTGTTSLFEAIRNTAGTDGGALSVGGGIQGNFDTPFFAYNIAGRNGGAMYVSGSTNSTLTDAVFFENGAGQYGGGLFADTSTGPVALSLSSTAGKYLLFMDNADSTGSNGIFFGESGAPSAAAATLDVSGAGGIFLFDPISVYMNNQDFTLTRDESRGSGVFLWGGFNIILNVGANSIININSGETQFAPDFTVYGSASDSLQVLLGGKVYFDMGGRDQGNAFFSFSGNTGDTLTYNNLNVSAPRSLLPHFGTYLIAEGIDASATGTDYVAAFVNASKNGTITLNQSYKYKIEFIEINGDLYLIADFAPYDNLGPNAGNAIDTANIIVNTSDLTDDEISNLQDDINSITPEAAVTMARIGMNLHVSAAELAKNMAFDDRGNCRSLIQYFCETKNRFFSDIRLWGTYWGDFTFAESADLYSGYDTINNGFIVGASTNIMESDFSVGIYGGAGFSDTSFRDITSDIHTTGLHVGILGRYAPYWGLKILLSGAYTYNGNDMVRNPGNIGDITGNFGQHLFSFDLKAAYDLELWQNGHFIPFVSGRQLWLRQAEFTEDGRLLAAKTEAINTNEFTMIMGIAVKHDFAVKKSTVMTAGLNAGWRHDFGDERISSASTYQRTLTGLDKNPSYTVKSLRQNANAMEIGADFSASFALTRNVTWALHAVYNAEIREGFFSNDAYAGISFTFK
ncbi:autotransporter domain-containing protein [Breznakiella homolactica]|uniref:Autotransporter domain-containing protein n=1 Tax=Breznakiella homolactica TaxID=2798577 RepID=A0A7T7XK67_9SPIR|nr:autotransporter outer membrane beta-barrel domain-containing protein [Breznakiella homolactica]QQO07752.1 autotransporter domain-containing protein [Breznakiella homolactica]